MRQRDLAAGQAVAAVVSSAKGAGRPRAAARAQRRLAGLGIVAALGLLALGGCDLGIDPDSLVRELRILAIRVTTGDPAASPSTAELQAQVVLGGGGLDLAFTTSSVTLSTLVGAPTGPGRRLLTPRPLQYDWFLCIGVRSLYSPGTLDPGCRLWGPMDPDPKTNSSLVYLNSSGPPGAGSSPELTIPTDPLRSILLSFLQTVLAGGQGGGMADMGGPSLPTRPLVILLPVLLRTSVVGGDPADGRDSEVGYNYLRVVIAVPALGLTLPPPNRNPVLDAALGSLQPEGAMQPLSPCPTGAGPCQPFAAPAPLFISGRAVDGSIETYNPIDDSGRMNIPETLRFSWFSSDGEFTQERTGSMRPQTQWQNGEKYPAPSGVTNVQLWLVLQDERGGVDWQKYELLLQ